MTEKMQRRDFLKKATAVATAGSLGYLVGCNAQPEATAVQSTDSTPIVEKDVNIQTQQNFEWKIVTTWPTTLPIMMDGVRMMVEQIETASDGRLKIEVFGAGELVPALESFDAASQGTADMSHGASYYWGGKIPASQFFTSVPFGLNAQQMYAWMFGGGGLELWEEAYADVGLVPMPAGNTGVQMGGWFNKELNTAADWQGIKMRLPGLGGKAIAELGASAELLPGGELYTSLERGVIDATEWVGPYHDEIMGFHKVAQYYYYPGWHEPGSVLEVTVNRDSWDALPSDLQQIVRNAAYTQNTWMLGKFDAENNDALERLINDEGVELRPFSAEIMDALRTASKAVANDLANSDPVAKKVYDSFTAFEAKVANWGAVSEKAFYNLIQQSTV